MSLMVVDSQGCLSGVSESIATGLSDGIVNGIGVLVQGLIVHWGI